MKKHTSSSETTALVVTVAALLIGVLVNQLPDAVFLPLFCRIPAHLAAAYYQVGLSIPALTFSVYGDVIQVSRSCGASTFFSLCASLLLTRLGQRQHPATGGARLKFAFHAGWFVAVSWALTLFVNSARLVFIVPVTAAAYFFPERFGASIHMASGMLVFLCAFVALWFVSENWFLKRSDHEKCES